MWLWFAAIVLINFMLSRWLVPAGEAPVSIPYTLFKEQVAANNVAAIYSQGEEISGRFSTPIEYPAPGKSEPRPPGARSAGWEPTKT